MVDRAAGAGRRTRSSATEERYPHHEPKWTPNRGRQRLEGIAAITM